MIVPIPIFSKLWGQDKVLDFLESKGFSKGCLAIMLYRRKLSSAARELLIVEATKQNIPIDLVHDFVAAHCSADRCGSQGKKTRVSVHK